MNRTILWSSILLNLLLIAAGLLAVHKLGGFRYLWFKMQNRGLAGVYEHRKDMFDRLTIPEGATVFLGNSITEQANWQELLGREDVYNRGIAGDVTQGVLDRLQPIVQSKPKRIFLMIGVNDLIAHSPDQIIQNYRTIVARITAGSPETRLILQSVLPVNNQVRPSGISNSDIDQLNLALTAIAAEYGLDFIDLHKQLKNETGQLNDRFTKDGIHLNLDAYLIWKKLLLPYWE